MLGLVLEWARNDFRPHHRTGVVRFCRYNDYLVARSATRGFSRSQPTAVFCHIMLFGDSFVLDRHRIALDSEGVPLLTLVGKSGDIYEQGVVKTIVGLFRGKSTHLFGG